MPNALRLKVPVRLYHEANIEVEEKRSRRH